MFCLDPSKIFTKDYKSIQGHFIIEEYHYLWIINNGNHNYVLNIQKYSQMIGYSS